MHDGKQVDAGEARMIIGLFQPDFRANLAGVKMAVFFPRPLPER